MEHGRRQYDAEFKREALRLLESSEKRLPELARDLGLYPALLWRWRREAQEAGSAEAAFPGQGKRGNGEEEVERLRRELEQVKLERDFYKKSGGVLRKGVAVKYAVIAAHRKAFPLVLMCRVLRVSRSGFYAWVQRGPSARAQGEEELREAVRRAFRENHGRYGSPRILRDLRAQGIRTSKRRVERLMREEGLRARPRRRFVVTTDSAHAEAVASNQLERQFSVDAVAGPDRVWVSDITYLWTAQGWLYLAVVLDLATRRVVGWGLGATLETTLVLQALRMALGRRRPPTGLLHHSDRGCQYASAAYRAALAAAGITASMSRKGNCWDNAVAESFFATLKWELARRCRWATRAEARSAVFEYIEAWYNRRRRHSSLGYVSPAEYELALTRRTA
ncbi:MAG TPA: IS3 family transposase [Gemmatimonadales bacterium]